MKTGITTASYYIGNTEKVDYKLMKSHMFDCGDYGGFVNVENEKYSMSDDELKKTLSDEKKEADEAGIEISQVHAIWPCDNTSPEKIASAMKSMKISVRGTSYLGSKNLVVHPIMPDGWATEIDADANEKINAEYFSELCAYAADFGVNICIENMPMKAHRLSPIPKIVEFVEKLDIPNFFICLDTGHCNVFGHDCGEMVRLCGKKLKVLHVHDNTGRSDEHRLPYCGTIDWESFKAALHDVGFEGSVSIESKIKRTGIPFEIREQLLREANTSARYFADILN